MHIELLNFTFNWQELVNVVVKITLALICGGVLGIERGRKKRPAGFRTYMLVCLGATLVMMTNEHLFKMTGTGDVARLGAQVISGIGFLGAGTIITTGGNRVKGLTTAAGLWAAACIGLAIGSGYYEGAIFGTLAIILIMVVFHRWDKRFARSTKLMILYIEFAKMSSIRNLVMFAKENDIRVEDVEVESAKGVTDAKVVAVVTLGLPMKENHEEVIEKICAVEGIIIAEEI